MMFGNKKRLEAIRREYQEKLEELNEVHEAEQQATSMKHQEELEHLGKECQILRKKLEVIEKAHTTELEALQAEQDAKVQTLKVAQEAKVQEFQQESERLKDKCKALQAENDRVYAGHRGMEEEIHFLKYRAHTLDELHDSVVIGTWPHDGSFHDHICRYPFENIEILPRGEAYTCCSAYLKHNYDIGNIFKEDFQEIWNSQKARRLRYSVQEGNFEYCQKYCKFLHEAACSGESCTENPVVLKKDAADICQVGQANGYAVKGTPKYITLSCDETCNLHCPTCRSNVKGLDAQESDRLYERLVKVVTPMLKECRMLTALGSGEVFASSAVSRFLKTITAQKFPNLKLTIITNLQLADAKKWEEFSNLYYIPKTIRVSVDASCSTTYEENRRGGGWNRLMDNLAYLCSLKGKEDRNVDAVWLNFVVQKNNYQEMKAFVRMAEEIGVDGVEFQKLANWGTFCEKEYLDRDVFQKGHPKYSEAYAILQGILEKGSKKLEIMQNILSPDAL